MKAPAKDSAYAGAYMISSRIYDQHLKHNDFSGARKWVKDVQKDRPWSFGILKNDHWIAVVIDWQGKWIRCYNPLNELDASMFPHYETLEVSYHMLDFMFLSLNIMKSER